jgi:hypothetical protein
MDALKVCKSPQDKARLEIGQNVCWAIGGPMFLLGLFTSTKPPLAVGLAFLFVGGIQSAIVITQCKNL